MRATALLILLAFTLGIYLTASYGSGLLDDADSVRVPKDCQEFGKLPGD